MSLFPAMLIKANGGLEYYNQNIDIDWPDSSSDVDTVPGGAEGVAPGPDKCVITITNAVTHEAAGYDWNAAKIARTKVPVLTKQIGNTSKKLQGDFIVRSFKRAFGGPGQPTIDSITMQSVGSPVPSFQ